MIPSDQKIIDASRYLAEIKQDAVKVLVPSPEEKHERIDLVGLLSGRRPSLYRLYCAEVEEAGWIALSKLTMPKLTNGRKQDDLDAVRFIRTHSVSLDGFRSKQVVEIGKSDSSNERKTMIEWVTSRLRK